MADINGVADQSFGSFINTGSGANLRTYSNDFSRFWVGTGITPIANNTTAPDGTSTGTLMRVTNNGQTVRHMMTPVAAPISWTAGQTYTYSIYLKSGIASGFDVNLAYASGTAIASIRVNTATGELITPIPGATWTLVGNGWYRLTYTTTAAATGAVRETVWPRGVNYSEITWLSVNETAFYIWNAQNAVGTEAGSPEITGATAPIIISGARGKLLPLPVIATAEQTFGNFMPGSIGFNLRTYSNDFTKIWGPVGVAAILNATLAPDGSQTGTAIVSTLNGGQSRYIETPRATPLVWYANQTYTYSVYLKRGPLPEVWVYLTYAGGSSFSITQINFADGTLGQSAPGTKLTAEGNGWYRLSVTWTMPANISASAIQETIWYRTASNTIPAASAGETVFSVWVAQSVLGTEARAPEITGATVPTSLQGGRAYLGAAPLMLSVDQTVGAFTNAQSGKNLHPYSGEFSQLWAVYNVQLVPNSMLAPDERYNATLIRAATTSTLGKYIETTNTTPVQTVAGEVYTWSIYVRAADGGLGRMRISLKNSGYQTFLEADINTIDGSILAKTPVDADVRVQPLDNYWKRVIFTFTAPTTGSMRTALTPLGGSESYSAPVGYPLGHVWGVQFQRGMLATPIEVTGATAPMTYPGARLDAGPSPLFWDIAQTVPTYASNASMIHISYASAEQTIDPFTQAAVALPSRFASADLAIAEFQNEASGAYLHLAAAAQTFDAYIQEALIVRPQLGMSGNSLLGEFNQNDGSSQVFIGNSALAVGLLATTTSVFVPPGTQEGDMIVLLAGGHSNGINDMNFMVPGFILAGIARSAGGAVGYNQAISVWYKIAGENESSVTTAYNLPTNYTDTVVWSQVNVFRNVGRIEETVVTVIPGGTDYKDGPVIQTRGTGRTVAGLWMQPNYEDMRAPNFWGGNDLYSDVGPRFSGGFYFAGVPAPAAVPMSVAAGRYSPTLNISFALASNRTEGLVGTHATAEQDLGTFLSIKDVFGYSARMIEPFVSRAYSTPQVIARQTVAPFTSNASGALAIAAAASPTIAPVVSAGFELVKLRAAQDLGVFTGASAIAAIAEGQGTTGVGPLVSNGALTLVASLIAEQQIDPFTSGSIQLRANATTQVASITSKAIGSAPVSANTNTMVGAFQAQSLAHVAIVGSGETNLGAFVSGDIVTRASGETSIDRFSSNASLVGTISATAVLLIESFINKADDWVHAEAAMLVGEFILDAQASPTARANANVTIDRFEQTQADGLVLVKGKGSTDAMQAFTQNITTKGPWTPAQADQVIEEFTSGGSMQLRNRPAGKGGVKFKGGFKNFSGSRFNIRGQRDG